MHFDAGKLNKRISFMTYGETKNDIGQITMGEVVHKTVWASVKKTRAYELSIKERLSPESVYLITTRYHKGITESMTIKYGDRKLHITSIVNVDEGNFALEITATDKGDK